jgi:hypothetical protein
MKSRFTIWLLGFLLVTMPNLIAAENGILHLPKIVEAGSAFSIPTTGEGKAVLYIAGPTQVLRRNVQLGQPIHFAPGELCNAGYYVAVLKGKSVNTQSEFDVVAAHQPAALSFLAKPSRLPVNQPDGISGVVYVFDAFRNLVLAPTQVSFQLAGISGAPQSRSALTREGVAWVRMNSAPKAGAAQFRAGVGSVTESRVIQQVPGDPCKLRISGRQSGERILLETEPVRDCSGNPVPDGTIISFMENGHGTMSTVDVPLKKSVARTEMPVYNGAVISVASGVVLGNEIRLGEGQPR